MQLAQPPTGQDPARARPVGRSVDPEWVLLACALLWLPLANAPFLRASLQGMPWPSVSTGKLAVGLAVALAALHLLLIGLLAWGRLFKPVLIVLLLVAAGASHFIGSYGIVIDAAMLRNALVTHWTEARELLNLRLAGWLLWAGVLPAALLWRLPLRRRPWRQALGRRLALLLLALVALLMALFTSYRPLSSLMRNHRDLRYMITPANVLWSGATLAAGALSHPVGPQAAKLPVGADARLDGPFAGRSRPAVLVLVVGETARAQNWGLNGYARETTPQLARLAQDPEFGLINYPQASSCGTDTASSLPCMFAAIGRRNYDAGRIQRSENLLHVLARAGVGVRWVDNQSGCKGVCDGFDFVEMVRSAEPAAAAAFCAHGSCLDEVLLQGLAARLAAAHGPQLLVLHTIGSHGPAYHRRVPADLRHFQPACESDDLHTCSAESIVNAYDNSLRYTDQVLATLLRELQALAPKVDSALIYLSDHGESLGENGLYLHGLPYALAPQVQTRVPMLMWLSPSFAAARGLDRGCLARNAVAPVGHDHLFHTVLGLFDVHTSAREAAWDLTHGCTRAPTTDLPRAAG